MPFFQRTAAASVLILQLFMGMRPAVLLEQAPTPAGQPAAASVPDCHRVESVSSGATDTSHAAHMAADAVPSEHESTPAEHAPSEHAPSHHDGGGCHSAPCCAPVMEGSATLTVVASVALIGFQRPLSGAARIVWVDGARRRPPSTAPPAVTLA